MATAAKKDDIPLPIAILAVFLIIAFTLGQADFGGGPGGGGDRDRSQSSTKDPCHGKSKWHVIDKWRVGDVTVRLRCGQPGETGFGLRHAGKHGITRKHALECIGRALLQGERSQPKSDRYVYQYNFGAKEFVRVTVIRRTGNILTAYVRYGSWEDCVTKPARR